MSESMHDDTPFSRKYSLRSFTRHLNEVAFAATSDECAILSQSLSDTVVRGFHCRFKLDFSDARGVLAQGLLSARVEMRCVISGQVFESMVEEAFDVRFVRQQLETSECLIDIEAIDEISFDGRELDLGATAWEQFLLALPAWPRAPGVQLEHVLPDCVEAGEASVSSDCQKPGPFADLARQLTQKKH